MKIFLDTNVLVAAVIQQHAFHDRSFAVLDRVMAGRNEGLIASHSLAEMYSVLTRLPPPYRHTPEQAVLSIEENVLKHFQTICLAGSDYATLLRAAAGAGIQGGTIHDAVLLRCAEISGADRIYTLNLKHFRAIATPEGGRKLSEP